MRRIELTWDDGAWDNTIAVMILEDLMHALDNPLRASYPWVRPDSVRVMVDDEAELLVEVPV